MCNHLKYEQTICFFIAFLYDFDYMKWIPMLLGFKSKRMPSKLSAELSTLEPVAFFTGGNKNFFVSGPLVWEVARKCVVFSLLEFNENNIAYLADFICHFWKICNRAVGGEKNNVKEFELVQ